MELAVYIGFLRKIILGIDFDYSKAVNHIEAYSVQDNPNAAYLRRESIKLLANGLEHGIIILNATRNAKLDVFEKFSMEDILSK